MNNMHMLNVSDATVLAIHALVILELNKGRPVSARAIAARLNVSQAHLAKVLQRLSKAKLVHSTRGPKGGFVTSKGSGNISLLEIYSLIDGTLVSSTSGCLLGKPRCKSRRCVVSDFIEDMANNVKQFLAETRLSDLVSSWE